MAAVRPPQEDGPSHETTPDDRRDKWGRDESDGGTEDRAQLILITGLTLAVIFVAVILILNTVIYTENLATRGVDAGGGEAIEFRDDSVDDVAALIEREHRNESSVEGVAADLETSADAYASNVAELRARDGAVADVDVRVTETGGFIAQDRTDGESRAFIADDDSTATNDWTVASNATRTRNYRLTVDPESLAASPDDAFTVMVDATGGVNATWSMSLSSTDGDELTLTITDESGTVSETVASGPDGTHTVDVTGGTVNGDSVDALVWAAGVQDETTEYDIEYERGGNATGTYHLVVDRLDDPNTYEDEPYGPDPTNRSSQPYVVDAVYSANVEIVHRTPELTYGDVVRLAPGERDA